MTYCSQFTSITGRHRPKNDTGKFNRFVDFSLVERFENTNGARKLGTLTTALAREIWSVTVCLAESWEYCNVVSYSSQVMHSTKELQLLTASFPDMLVGWLSGRTFLVSDRRTFTGLYRTCSWWVTIYMGKPSAVSQPTRPTQPFILTGSINE